MTNRNANKSSPGQPAGQGAAGDAAPQPHPPPLPQQPSRGYDTPNFVPQEHPLLAQQRALSQDSRRRPDEGVPGPAAAPPAERAMPWGDPRPRRRQDREAGPSDKQVYVPPVTLPPNREHQAMDLQKIQVAPSLLKGVDERNRPTMRRIPVHGMPPPPGAPDGGQGGVRPGGVRTARVGVGSGVWPPPEEPRKQRPLAAPSPQPVAAAPRPGMPPSAARPDPATAAAAAALVARRRGAPLGLFALLVFLGSATVAGFWVLWRAANPPIAQDAARVDEVRGPTPEPRVAAPAPSALPEQPPAAASPPVALVAEPPPPAAPEAPSAVPSASATPAPPRPVAAARPPSTRPAVQAKRPPKAPPTPEDVYEPTVSTPNPPQALPSAPAALPSAPPGTTAPPRPFP